MWFLSPRKTRRSQTSRPAVRRPGYRPRLEALEDRCLLSAGALDPTFNPTGSPPGTATVAVNAGNAHDYDVLVQPSGKIVLTGSSNDSKQTPHFSLAQFNSNGSLDPTFGSGGTVITAKGTITPYVPYDAVLYPTGGSGDEKILLAGYGSTDFALVRYNADGSLDTLFGNGGMVGTSFKQGRGADVNGVVLVPNGMSPPKIVMVGSSANDAGVELARYNPDGSLDTTFGSRGTAYVAISGSMGVSALALDPVSGDLIVTDTSGLLAAFTSNGTLDNSFGQNGLTSTGIANLHGLAVYPATDGAGNAGKIVVAGSGAVARYTVAGTPDPSWSIVSVTPSLTSVAIQADDKVLADGGFQLVRYNTDGSLDSSFGTGGMVTIGLSPTIQAKQDVTLQPNGDILVAGGCTTGGGNSLFGVARCLASEPQIGSFTANPNPVPAGSSLTLTASNITDANPNSTITQVAFYVDTNGDGVLDAGDALLGYATQTSPGVWTLTSASAFGLTAGTYTLFAQAEDSYGVFGDPDAITLTVQ
jgi:uncharacterized delta-60 repeat protein